MRQVKYGLVEAHHLGDDGHFVFMADVHLIDTRITEVVAIALHIRVREVAYGGNNAQAAGVLWVIPAEVIIAVGMLAVAVDNATVNPDHLTIKDKLVNFDPRAR